MSKWAPTGAVAVAAITFIVATLLAIGEWAQPSLIVEGAALALAAVVAAVLTTSSCANHPATMPPAFVIHLTTMLLLGPQATLPVVAAGAVTQLFGDPRSRASIVLDAVIVSVALQTAGLVHESLGGTLRQFIWPYQGLPIAAAVIAYCGVHRLSGDVIVPLITRRAVEKSWPVRALRSCPHYFIGAGVAVAAAHVINGRAWQIVPVAAVPLYFACRTYADYRKRLEAEDRRCEVIELLEQGMAVIDSGGQVTLWNEAAERITGCPRQRALGRSVINAVPALANGELSRAIGQVLAERTARTLPNVALPSPAGAHILQIKILPFAEGATLLWTDVTDLTRTEQALKRNEERLAHAAEGAHDGLWAWDFRSRECYFSGRWRALVGLPAQAGTGQPEEWLNRVHPDDVASLKEALEAHLSGKTEHFQHEHRIRHEDGTYRPFLCRGVAQQAAGRKPVRIAGSLTDAGAGAVAQKQLRNAGFLDPLTGLCNRAVFVEGLGRRLAEFKEQRSGDRFAVLYLDLDRFKVVNDSLGHLVGDELLTAVSRRLESCLRPEDALARLGGDEFAILLNGLSDEQQANAIAFRIQKALSAPVSIDGRDVFTSASIGIAFGRSEYTNPDEIMRDADTAMYHAKARGKARHELFDADMHARALDRLGLENDLRHAINSNDFEVHYQPIVSLSSGMCVGFESLVRWTRNGEAVSPATFIPIAEELGLIEPLGTWVLQQACRTFADWQRQFPDGGLDCITVNVSSRQLMQQNFLHIVEQAVDMAGLKPCDLRLEITETALMDSPNVAASVLRELRDFGVKIYLDDFGTGYSSLSHLHKLPVDALKIDRSFVRSLQLADRPAIVESILALARTLNTSVVAEGIESAMQAHELERLGCTHAQGYLFSRPLSMRSAEQLLITNQPLGPKSVASLAAARRAEVELYSPSVRFQWPDHITGGDSSVRLAGK